MYIYVYVYVYVCVCVYVYVYVYVYVIVYVYIYIHVYITHQSELGPAPSQAFAGSKDPWASFTALGPLAWRVGGLSHRVLLGGAGDLVSRL